MEKTLANRDRVIKAAERCIPNLYDYFTKNEVKRMVWGHMDSFYDHLFDEDNAYFAWLIFQEYGGREIRRCDHCGRLMVTGYHLEGDYACSDDCRNKLYMSWYEYVNTPGQAAAMYALDYKENDDEYYYTEWE